MMSEEGFTLLETMFALVIVAVAFPVLLSLRNVDVELESRARTLTRATLLAQEKLVESELAGFLPTGEQSGDFRTPPPGNERTEQVQDRAPGFTWTRHVSATPFKGIRNVRIRVSWHDQGAEDALEVTSYVFQAIPR